MSPRAWDTERGDWAELKDPHFNKPQTAKDWRYEWPKLQNRYLEDAGWDVRISCTAADSDEALPLKSETLPNRDYHIERRDYAQEPTTAHKDAEFNRAHNGAIRALHDDLATLDTPEGQEAAHNARVAAWWHNMARHVGSWRDDLSEAAQEWRQRFEHQRLRVQALFGREMPRLEPCEGEHHREAGQGIEPPEQGHDR